MKQSDRQSVVVISSSGSVAAATTTRKKDDEDTNKGQHTRGLLSNQPPSTSSSSPSSPSSPSSLLQRPTFLLTILVFQNSTAAVVGRSTRSGRPKEELFSITNYLLVCEFAKLMLSLLLEYCHQKGHHNPNQKQQGINDEDSHKTDTTLIIPNGSPDNDDGITREEKNDNNGNLSLVLSSLRMHIWKRPVDTMQLLPPALLFLGSNTFRYVAQGHLPVPTFQVIVQGRLVTTAMWSVLLLPSRTYSWKQWICLSTTTLGLIVVVLGETTTKKKQRGNNNVQVEEENEWIGILSLLAASLLSSLASVYLEKIYKAKKAMSTTTTTTKNRILVPQQKHDNKIIAAAPPGHHHGKEVEPQQQQQQQQQQQRQMEEQQPSLWIRNIQLAVFSIMIATIQNCSNTTNNTNNKSFFHGFHALVWLQVFLFSVGGVLVAAVTKYADSVLKGLATAISMLVSSILSLVVLGTPIRSKSSLGLGATTIILSVYLFSNPIPDTIQNIIMMIRKQQPQQQQQKRKATTKRFLLLLLVFLVVFCVVHVLFLQSGLLLLTSQQQDSASSAIDYWMILQSPFNQSATATTPLEGSEQVSVIQH